MRISGKRHAPVGTLAATEHNLSAGQSRHRSWDLIATFIHKSLGPPSAAVVVSPSDHFVRDENRFVEAVASALRDLQRHPEQSGPVRNDPQARTGSRARLYPTETAFPDDPHASGSGFYREAATAACTTSDLQGALWNTMVFTLRSTTLWQMVRDPVPSLYNSFGLIRSMSGSVHAPGFIENIYQPIPNVNFSSEICAQASQKVTRPQGTECRLERLGNCCQYRALAA